jgi:hypothetical protein
MATKNQMEHNNNDEQNKEQYQGEISRRKTHDVIYLVQFNNDLLLGRVVLSVPLIKRVIFLKDSKRNYKNHSSNLIIPFSRISFRDKITH